MHRDIADESMDELVGRVWAEALGVSAVAAEDDFFDSGGTSIAAFRIAADVSGELGLSEGIAWTLVGEVFAQPTPKAFATFLKEQMPSLRLQDELERPP
jgi:hypothetical protein